MYRVQRAPMCCPLTEVSLEVLEAEGEVEDGDIKVLGLCAGD